MNGSDFPKPHDHDFDEWKQLNAIEFGPVVKVGR